MTDVPISGSMSLKWTYGQGCVTHAMTTRVERIVCAWCVSESWLAWVSG
ncbi:hypothetical protein AS9A_1686 [Hoyosella subflava DQS3-9A1]|uniref:Uncharacterized protein n=1 Tax=Hoyosella subflava (strain DSM 45089 / JCM 17490 / NBRC 109087 / DQS3-9A1) TaxID=443218 RepID=F6EKJ9_HOYSD|nr:hypothetical protein AS9A_1686 [Hoyosella subflava DQS3-9A1]